MDLHKRIDENDRQFIFRIGNAKENGSLDLDWQEITDIFNQQCNEIKQPGDVLAKSTYAQQYKIARLYYDDVFKKYNTTEADQEAIQLLENKKQELYKEKVRTQDAAREYRKNLRDEARIENLLQAIQADVDNFHPDIYPLEPIQQEQGKQGILCIGDWHIGCMTDNFYNSFNLSIAEARVAQLCTDTIRYCKMFNITELHVVNLSDLIENNIWVSARVCNEIDAIEQVKQAARLLCQLLVSLSAKIPTIYYHSVVDNHSRITVDKSQHIEKESLCKIIDWWLEEKINIVNKDFKEQGLDNCIVMASSRIDDSVGYLSINGYNIMFEHGHLGKKESVIQDLALGTNMVVDVVIVGHWHIDAVKTFQGKKVFFNGSLKGVDNYAVNNRLFCMPSQTLLCFDNNNIIETPITLVAGNKALMNRG